MQFIDQLLAHDAWATRQLLQLCEELNNTQLDTEFDVGLGSLRRTLEHIIYNMEVWGAMMASEAVPGSEDQSVEGFVRRLGKAAEVLSGVASRVCKEKIWDEYWVDDMETPPQEKSYGTALAHIITHSMHHRAQIRTMLRKSGVGPLPEGDVFSWEAETMAAADRSTPDTR